MATMRRSPRRTPRARPAKLDNCARSRRRSPSAAPRTMPRTSGRSPLLGLMHLDDDRGERGREGKRHDSRNHHCNRDGHRELLVQRARDAARNATGRNTATSTRTIEISARRSRHGALGRLERRERVLGHVDFDVLDHHDRVVDHQADRQDHAEQRQHIDREAEQVHADEGADDRHWHRENGITVARRLCRNTNTTATTSTTASKKVCTTFRPRLE